MDAETLIALTKKRRTAQGLGLVVTDWHNYTGTTDVEITRSRTEPFTIFCSTAEQRDKQIAAYRAVGLTVEVL